MQTPLFPSTCRTTIKFSPSLAAFEPKSATFSSQRFGRVVRCESNSSNASQGGQVELTVGSPIVITVEPPALKTATAMPSLRANNGQIRAGDVGRIVARKPMDVWAVRLAIGTYLLDGKYFKPMDVEELDKPESET
ncbi:hypothetical protein LUZ60_010256 [Juncus effusus]|nr:hypothetical protein LUZ60_010256 [Juncus effusus]